MAREFFNRRSNWRLFEFIDFWNFHRWNGCAEQQEQVSETIRNEAVVTCDVRRHFLEIAKSCDVTI